MRATAVILCGVAFAASGLSQEASVPAPDGPAVSVADDGEDEMPVRVEGGSPQGGAYHVAAAAYYSPTLRGRFWAQWMFILRGGSQVNFWGARVVQLDYDSPVWQLGLAPGDVITRLDGLSIANGMFREDGGTWQIVELDNHFGRTEVRFIHRGSNQVRIGAMMLDGTAHEDYPEVVPVSP
jgi:hypothetical protein